MLSTPSNQWQLLSHKTICVTKYAADDIPFDWLDDGGSCKLIPNFYLLHRKQETLGKSLQQQVIPHVVE